MENFLPSSSSSYSTQPTYTNFVATPLFSIDEPSPDYIPQFMIPPYDQQLPYACPVEQANQPLDSCSIYPFSVTQNGSQFGVPSSLVYTGLSQEKGFLDPQRTKLARIKRKLARQRTLSLSRNSSSSSSCSSSSSSSNSNSSLPSGSNELDSRRSFLYKSHAEAQHRSSVAKRDLYQFCTSDNKKLRVLLVKELKNSDVGSLGRIVLPKREAEGNLPTLSEKEGIQIVMKDAESNHSWAFKYKFWSNNKSRMYVLENTGDFVKQNGLEMGDFFTIYEDESKELYFSIKKAEKQTARSSNATEPNDNYNELYTSSFDYSPRDEDEASLALLIEQLKHKEQQDVSNLMSLPKIDDHPASSHEQPSDIANRMTDLPVASYDQEVMTSFEDCYGGLGLLPDVHSYHFSF